MNKWLIPLSILFSVFLVGCVTLNIPEEKDSGSNTETEETANEREAVSAAMPSSISSNGNRELYYSKACGPGEAIQTFDLRSADATTCVSIGNTETLITTPENDIAAGVHHDHFTLMINDDESTQTTIENGDIIDFREGEGITISKNDNIMTISAAIPTTSADMAVDGINEWRVVDEDRETKFTITDGESVEIAGTGATTVAFNSANQRITINTPEAEVYQFRRGNVQCNPDGTVTEDGGDVLDVVSCVSAGLQVKCDEGTIINYGGWCAGYAIGILDTAFSSTSSSWSDLPVTDKARIGCLGATNKGMFVTCIRKKPTSSKID